ncbi:isoprenylcysteine carboxylmethyltransferase family protein [Mycobacterium sp. 852002-51057_SCH5723018]|uniref:methyltransferase family protein n=1 Tax=Mycobacterium sp. 852002-51057_SCH5723018 TaxID=1834094 RepID=UPI0007FD4A0D|nr:isoprenylcysteine carboxylmethyltransferase family protein [Mycobacterium sp. 852002-51057_SCH5723018]OBG20605.1 RemK protein [Mycobacterium sp. 852002-51057_SCH5723018]
MVTSTRRRLWWRHLMSVLLFPVTVTLVVPALIVLPAGVRDPHHGAAVTAGLIAVGCLLIAAGLGLMVWTNVLFDRVGEGTLGLGNVMGEPVHLVVRGPYRHVRNPMITGVLCILLGEAAITASGALLGWFAIFLAFQATAIRFWEEPHLVQRYGREYVDYRRNVPRWIPRLSAWDPTPAARSDA